MQRTDLGMPPFFLRLFSAVLLLATPVLSLHASMTAPGRLGAGGGEGYTHFQPAAPANEQGVIGFSAAEYFVHEDARSALITVTRTCNAAQAERCAGEVSVAYTTETVPEVPLPGTFSVTVGSRVVVPTADLRNLLFSGDPIRIPWPEHRRDPVLQITESVTDSNWNAHHLYFTEPYAGTQLRAYHRQVRARTPGNRSHGLMSGRSYVATSEDLRSFLSRGDVVRIGFEQFTVSLRGEDVFNATHLPLDRAFAGYYPVGPYPTTSCPAAGCGTGARPFLTGGGVNTGFDCADIDNAGTYSISSFVLAPAVHYLLCCW
jgi:hypothetical protein